MKRYPVNEFNLGKNVYPMRIHTYIEHRSFVVIAKWVEKLLDKIFGKETI